MTLLLCDLNSLYEWSQVWKLNFNELKCKVLAFTINVTPIVFKKFFSGVSNVILAISNTFFCNGKSKIQLFHK